MNCPECGTPVGADEKFCGNCGSPLQDSPPKADQDPADLNPIDDSPSEPSVDSQDQPQDEAKEASEQESLPEDQAPTSWDPAGVETVYSEPGQSPLGPLSPQIDETPIPDPAGSFEEPTAPTPPSEPPVIQKGSKDKTLIIVIVVLVILLLCCCIAAVGVAVFLGNMEQLGSMSIILPTLAAKV